MKRHFLALTTASVLALTLPYAAHALQEATPLAIDKRLRTLVYDPNEVYKFVGHYKYQSSIELSAEEEAVTISMGDSLAWQVTPSGNRIFLKPIEPDATTNMTVITNKRIYHFELYGQEAQGIRDEDMVFQARFQYADDPSSREIQRFSTDDFPDIENEPGKFNFNYTISGSEYISPLKIFDDGEFTYFQFKNKNAELPAFFVVDSEGKEAAINYRMQGDYLVVERVSSQFTLRNGSDIACVFNEVLPLRSAPPKPKRKFLGLF